MLKRFVLIIFLSVIGFSQSPDITLVEYFIDVDPGRGFAQSVSFTADSIIDLNFNVNLDTVSVGMHTLYIRTLDDSSRWSITYARSFIKKNPTVSSNANLVYAEYFIDTDLGRGSNTEIPFTDANSIDKDFIADLSGISEGIHTLYIRTQDANDKWSIALSRVFVKDNATIASNANIVYLEYFIDADPGRGLGESVTVSSPSPVVDINFIANLDTLTDGIHTLYVRGRDANNKWSITHSRVFVKDNATVAGSADINYAEYYIDSDPGRGSGNSITIASAAPTVDLDFLADLSGLQRGMHSIYVRTRDANNKWSIAFQRAFVIGASATSGPIASINWIFAEDTTNTEYSFSDFIPADSVNLDFNLGGLENIPFGDYNLQVTAVDQNGNRSLPYSQNITKLNSDTPIVVTPIADLVLDEDFGQFIVDLAPVFDDDETADSNMTFTISGETILNSSTSGSDLILSSIQDAFGIDTLYIIAIDIDGNQAFDTVQVTITQIDDAPIKPTGLVLTPQGGQIKLEWVANSEGNISKYRIYRNTTNDTTSNSKIDSVASTILTYTNTNLNHEIVYYYWITAFDVNNLESSFSVVITGQALDVTAPLAPQNTTISTVDNSITIKWTKNTESDFAKYILYSGTSVNPTIASDSILIVSDTSRTYTNLTYDQTYFYRLKARDISGNLSSFSNEVSITPQRTPLHTELFVYQNPVATSQISIIENADANLSGNPLVTVAVNLIIDTISMGSIASSLKNYTGSYGLTGNGSYSISSKAIAVNGASHDTSRVFVATLVKQKIATTIALEQQFQIKIEENSFKSDLFVLSEVNTSDESYKFSPRLTATKEMQVRHSFSIADFEKIDKLFIYQRIGDQWFAIESQVYPRLNHVVAYTTELAEYRIEYNADYEGTNIVPDQFALKQNYPNPFNPNTIIQYDLAIDGFVNLTIYNMLGQKIKTIVNQFQRAKSQYKFNWDARSETGNKVASGIYIYVIQTAQFSKANKMVLIK